MNTQRTGWRVLAALVAGLSLRTAADGPLEPDALTIYQQPAPDGKVVFILAPKEGGGLVGGGLAVDKSGQMYVSDYGTSLRPGGVYLQPADGSQPPVLIMGKLKNPSDIEVAPDQKSLIIAQPDGQVVRQYFGVSVRAFFPKIPRDPIAFLLTSDGWISARLSSDGYFHFPGVMRTQKRTKVDVEIQDESQTYTFFGKSLNVDAGGNLVGHSIVDVVLKE